MERKLFTLLFILPICLGFSTTILSDRHNETHNVGIFEELEGSVTSKWKPGDFSVMEWFGRTMNQHEWSAGNLKNTNNQCFKEMIEYLRSLRNGSLWAAKMHDATGRYNGQFFFGNDFWLGSSTLCWDLANPTTNSVIPPFAVKFYVVKMDIYLDKHLTPKKRRLSIGLCLPLSCRRQDVSGILQDVTKDHAAYGTPVAEVSVGTVRPVPGDYEMLKDTKFHIIFGVGSITIIIIIIASIYEYYIERKQSKEVDCEMDGTCAARTNNNTTKATDCRPISLIHTAFSNVVVPKSVADEKQRPETNKLGQGIGSQLLLSFSALSNGTKILSAGKTSEESLTCIHGLRFLSLTWVIMVHTYLQVFNIAENKSMRTITERNFMYQTISNATFSVDTFFFISGLLVTILYFRTAAKKQATGGDETKTSVVGEVKTSTLKFFMLLFYRFVRLTPAYLFVIGVNEVVLRWAHNTSVFEPSFWDHVTCAKYWWRNALYINSLYPQEEMCMLWSWYMSNDTQFYILGIILLLVAVKHLKVAVVSLVIILISSWITTFSISYTFGYRAIIEEPFFLFDQLYDKPWTRVGPYLIGMVSGWILFNIKSKLRIPYVLNAAGWILSITCFCSLVYGLGSKGLDVPTSSVYVSLGHTAWSLALAWMTISCCTGYGGPINVLLSWKGLLPLSRLTYCAYLVHPMIMEITGFQLDGPIHLHNGMILTIFLGNVVLSLVVSFAISMCFEAPVVRLLKIIMGNSKKED